MAWFWVINTYGVIVRIWDSGTGVSLGLLLLQAVVTIGYLVCFPLGLFIAARVVRFQELPRAWEWLPILLSLKLLVALVPALTRLFGSADFVARYPSGISTRLWEVDVVVVLLLLAAGLLVVAIKKRWTAASRFGVYCFSLVAAHWAIHGAVAVWDLESDRGWAAYPHLPGDPEAYYYAYKMASIVLAQCSWWPLIWLALGAGYFHPPTKPESRRRTEWASVVALAPVVALHLWNAIASVWFNPYFSALDTVVASAMGQILAIGIGGLLLRWGRPLARRLGLRPDEP